MVSFRMCCSCWCFLTKNGSSAKTILQRKVLFAFATISVSIRRALFMVQFQSWRWLWLLYSQGAPCDKNYNYFFLSELHALFKAHDAILLTNAGELIIFCRKNWRDKEKFMFLIHFYFQKLVHPSQTQARSQTRFPKTKMFFAKMTMGAFQLRRKARPGLLKSNPCSNVKDKRILQKHKNDCDD